MFFILIILNGCPEQTAINGQFTILSVNRNSFQCGVMCLRRLNYDRKELERRREESHLEFKGNCPH